MADSSPEPTSTGRQVWNAGLPLMTWLAIAVVFLVAITIAGDDDPSSADVATGVEQSASGDGATGSGDGETAATGEEDVSAGDSGGEGSADAGSSAAGASEDDAGGDSGSGPDEGAGGDGPTASITTQPPAAGSGSEPTTTVAGSPTTNVEAPPPTTTTPPTTIVVTAPTTTVVVTAPATTTTVPPPAADDCTVLGVDELGDIVVELTAVNPSSLVAQLEVGFVLFDSAGEEIISDLLVIEFVSPGEVSRIAVPTFEPVPGGGDPASVSCEIDAVQIIEPFPDQRLPGPNDACSVTGLDEVGDIQLDVTVQNPDPEPGDLIFTYAVRDAQGVRVISDVDFADGLDAGAVASVQVDTLTPPPGGLDPSTLTCAVVGLELF